MDEITKGQFALEKAKFKAQLELKKEMHKGNDGYTPVKGKDYFTEREIAEIRNDIQSMIRVPEDGKDAVVDYEKILRYTYAKVAEHVAAIPRPKDGEKGEKGDDAVVDLDELVRKVITQIPKQKDKKFIIDKKQIEALIDERVKTAPQQIVRLGASVASIRALTDVNLDGLAQDERGNYILGGGTASNITDLITAGTNVTITGSGTLADPYVINASGGGGSVNGVESVSGVGTRIEDGVSGGGNVRIRRIVDTATIEATIDVDGAIQLDYVGTSGGVTDGDKGDITVSASGATWTIDNQAVTRQKMEHIQSQHFLGRHAGSTGDVQEVSPAQARTILNVADGATANLGDVVGPASATDNAVARFDTTTGKLIQNSAMTVDDAGAFTATDGSKVTGSEGGGSGYIVQAIENTSSGGRAELSLDTDDGAFAGFVAMAGSATTNKARQFDIGTRVAGSLGLWTSDLQQVTIDPDGNVGIGTGVFNPTEKLEVDGNVIVGDATGNRYMYIESGNGRRAKFTQEGTGAAAPLRISSNGALQLEVDDTPVMTIADTGPVTFAQDVSVPDEAYGVGWNGSLEVPTKNALYDKIETITGSSGITEAQAKAISRRYAIALS